MDFQEMAKLAKVMKLASETSGLSAEEKTFKLLMSYLKPEQKKKAEVIVKYVEFENMAKKYKSQVYSQSGSVLNWRKNMLLDLRNSFDGKKRLKIDMLLKFMDLNEIVKNLEDYA